jgi:signal transduction histidine kinase
MLLGEITNRVTQLADSFIPADIAANRERREQARIFLYSHIFGPFIGNTVPISLWLLGREIDYRVVIMSASVTGFWLFPPLLRIFGRYYLLSVLSVQNLIFCILWSCYFYGGLNSPTVSWILTIPILAFMYVGHSMRMRIILILQFIVSTAIYYALSETLLPPQVTLAQSALQALGLVSTVAASLYVTMMAIFYANALASQVELKAEVDRHLVTAADLVAATEEARRSGTAKSDFIARMSHELRAPLNAIIGYSELLLENAENDEDKATIADLDRIRNAGRQLLKLVNRILDLSRAEAGRMEVAKEWVDCGELVDAVVRDTAALAAKNGDSVSFVRQGELGLIHTDSLKLKQVLANILENAVQYTHDGVIGVTASRAPAGSGDRITLSIADSGSGIERERLPHLLNNFETLDDDDHRFTSGAGLGLALSKKFCDLIGAKLSVESEIGRGSVFTVELPAAGARSQAEPREADLGVSQAAGLEDLKAVAERWRAETNNSAGDTPYAKIAAG